MPKMLIFDIWGRYAHFKKIYATTSALSYIIPSKTALYGYISAILGLDKFDNAYLDSFPLGACRLGIQVINPIVMQRVNTNLHPHDKGLIKATQNRKPTTMEYVYSPKYRIFFTHTNEALFEELEVHLKRHTSVYTPTLGLANLLSDFQLIGTAEAKEQQLTQPTTIGIDSVIPREAFVRFDLLPEAGNEIIEYSQFAVEMNTDREVTHRTDILIDRNGKPIRAVVNYFHTYQQNGSERKIILF